MLTRSGESLRGGLVSQLEDIVGQTWYATGRIVSGAEIQGV
jgi:hypothetical protein